MNASRQRKDILTWVNEKTEEAEKRIREKKQSHLSPIKHLQKDFFIADIFDAVTFRSDIASMEYPLFALKAGDTKARYYEINGFSVAIKPTADGIATIHDKDIWIYCISKLMQAVYEGEEISRTIHFTIYDYLITTNRGTSGEYYEKTKNALDRLSGTRITTEIETDKIKEARGFGLIDSWHIIEEKDGRMVRVEVTLPKWLYRSITTKKVLSISPDYFRLRKPLDRRVYELARKHCGNQTQWKVSLEVLYKKSGSTANLRKFRMNIKSLADSNELPDYFVQFDNDMVIFKNRNAKAYIKDLFNGNC
jgi:plasmid replication initiation protein